MTTKQYHYLPEQTQNELKIIADTLVAKNKGILAADESVGTMGRRLKDIGVENDEEARRHYRKLLFSAENLGDYISGVIMFHETVYQKSDDDVLLLDLLRERKVIPGIKVDKGVVPLYGTEDECTTQGLDDLGPRCEQYKKLGCHFAKWRCVFKIGPNTPSQQALQENASVLARFASVCQAYRLVPVVEAEVLPDGGHSILTCQRTTETVLATVFKALADHKVFLEGILLKTNMVTAGQSCRTKGAPEDVALATVTTLRRTVPVAVAGVVFLSGGQSEEEATVNLNAINRCAQELGAGAGKPWPLSFSYGRGLQTSVLATWRGVPDHEEAAQEELLERARANCMAAQGDYEDGEVTGEADNQELLVSDSDY